MPDSPEWKKNWENTSSPQKFLTQKTRRKLWIQWHPFGEAGLFATHAPDLWDKPPFIAVTPLTSHTLKIQSSKLPGPSRTLVPAFFTWHWPISILYCVDVDLLLNLRVKFLTLTLKFPALLAAPLTVYLLHRPATHSHIWVISHSNRKILEMYLLWETFWSSEPGEHRSILPLLKAYAAFIPFFIPSFLCYYILPQCKNTK